MPPANAPLLPRTAPFADEQIAALNGALAGSTTEQRQWLAGFLAGYAAAQAGAANDPLPAAAPASPARAAEPLLILYATESGNSEALAMKARDLAKRRGFKPTLRDTAETTPAEAAKAKNLLVIAATWGEGEPPQRATAFYDALMAEGTPSFEKVRFAVLALGDSSYANFCEIGRRIDSRLTELGGSRAFSLVECDLDFEEPAASWTGSALEALKPADEPGQAGAEIIRLRPEPVAPVEPVWSRKSPFTAELLERVTLTSSRSSRETVHLELSLEGSGLAYEPGDSLAVVPENDPAAVEAVMAAAGLAGNAELEARLRSEHDATTLSRPVIEGWHALRPQKALGELLENGAWQAWAKDRQLVDLLEAFPAAVSAEELTGLLRRLPERSYSLASSPLAHPDEAHLLVSVVRWASHGRDRKGVASTWLAERLSQSGTVPVFLKPNRHFRLPPDGDTPVVMIGPGTGIAPFRAFLEHRRETGAKGRNWLVFGERNYHHDFYYQLELQELERQGVLSRVDLAFSRDQREKVYVQHKLRAAGAELWAWLEEGAHLYLCGDAATMAKDVETTLREIAAEQGGLAADAATAWLAGLVKAGRFQRDVY
jgi:sulfite reductase (NADPH) flavoprotein alpha-component